MRTKLIVSVLVVVAAGALAWRVSPPEPAVLTPAPVEQAVARPVSPPKPEEAPPVAVEATLVAAPVVAQGRQRTDARELRRAMTMANVQVVAPAGPTPRLPAAPPVEAWQGVAIAPPFGVGTPSPEVTRAVRVATGALRRCFDPAEAASWGRLGDVFSRQPGLAPAAMGPAVLLLEVERTATGVRVVDAPAERRGSASDGTLACAQGSLRGLELPVATEGAERFRVRYALKP